MYTFYREGGLRGRDKERFRWAVRGCDGAGLSVEGKVRVGEIVLTS
jgi:hypothetical protein